MISLTSPVETAAHRWPAGLKLAGLCAATMALFAMTSLSAHLVVAGCVLAVYALPGAVFLRAGLARLRVLWPFLAIIAIWHAITGTLPEGAVIALRLLSAVALANLVTMTTRLTDMIAVLRWLTTPLRWLGLRTEPAEMAIALVIRFTPSLAEKGAALVTAWRARSPRRAGWQVILPFAVLAIDDAERVAEALRARGGLS